MKLEGSQRYCGGFLKAYSFWSKANNCRMKFNIYLPEDNIKKQRFMQPFPVLYFLSGLTCDITNGPVKSNFGPYAAKHKICVVFPDTSPRDI